MTLSNGTEFHCIWIFSLLDIQVLVKFDMLIDFILSIYLELFYFFIDNWLYFHFLHDFGVKMLNHQICVKISICLLYHSFYLTARLPVLVLGEFLEVSGK